MNSTIKRNVKQTRKFPAGNPSLPSKRLSIWDSTFTGNANWDARFIASYGRRASRRAVGVGFAPGARAPDPLPHHEPRPRETEGRRSIPLPAIALRSPQGRRGGVAVGLDVALRRAGFSRAVSLVLPNNYTALWGIE